MVNELTYGLIPGSEMVPYLGRDGRRIIFWALGGGNTGHRNVIQPFLPEAPRRRSGFEIGIEMIDWLYPEHDSVRGRRALYICSHSVLVNWLPQAMEWLLM